MNLPADLSQNATKVYNALSANNGPMGIAEILMAYAPLPADEERYKAISTADSLVVKGILSVETGTAENSQEPKVFYSFITDHPDSMPVEEADATEQYAKKTELNAEEESMIAIFKKWGKRLAENILSDLYERRFATPSNAEDQTDGGSVKDEHEELQMILKELTDAGLVTRDEEGTTFNIKKG